MPSLTQLRAFVEASRAGSFGAAARRMGLSQPAVSELVRRLEAELGTPLFSRNALGLQLTSAGETLRPHASRAVGASDDGAEAVRQLHEMHVGHARFGLLKNADLYLKRELALRFRTEYPGLRLTLTGQNSSATARAVASGAVEAGLIVLPTDQDDLTILPVLRDEVHYVSTSKKRVKQEHTIQSIGEAPLVLYDASLTGLDPLRRQVSARAQRAGVEVTPIVDVEHLSSALALVESGKLDTLAPRAGIPGGFHSAPLSPPMHDVLAFIKRRNDPLSSATREIIRVAYEALVEQIQHANESMTLLAENKDVVEFLAE